MRGIFPYFGGLVPALFLSANMCAPLFLLCSYAQDSPTLAEKIALAKKMADDAASGKTESGKVVNGTFNFAEELLKYRESVRVQKTSSEPSPSDDSKRGSPELPETSPEKSGETGIATNAGHGGLLAPTREKTLAPPDSSASPRIIPMVHPPKVDSKAVKPRYTVDMSGFSGEYYVGYMEDAKKTIEFIDRKLKESKKFSNAATGMFFIYSDNAYALSEIKKYADACQKLAEKFFGDKYTFLSDSNKIRLQVYISPFFRLKHDYSYLRSRNGTITISLNTSGLSDAKLVCNLLSTAVLGKVADMSGVKKTVPYWLETAFTQILRQSLVDGIPTEMGRISSMQQPENLNSILSYTRYSRQPQKVKESHCYWLAVCAEKMVGDADAYRAFIMSSISEGTKASEILLRGEAKRTGLDFDLWFRTVFAGEVWSHLGGINSPYWTDMEVARLSILQVGNSAGERIPLADSSLWENREKFENDIRSRITEIKVALIRCNPLFHNCLVTLGKMYESCLDDDESSFSKCRALFINEYGVAKELSAEVEKMMSE